VIEEDTLCGKYRLERKIAEGGFDEVWLVRHAELPKSYAAKFILDPACAAYLRREGDLLCSLEHPNVVLVVDAEFQAERPFIVMEYVGGGSLRDRLARGPIPLAEALWIARTILEVLVFAHAKGIVHRDLKPENILFDDRGQVKVCDFGLGKVLANQAASLVLSNAPTNSSGKVIVGTIEYMSPEQRAGGPSDPRNDLFSWGVILYEMLLRRRPAGFVIKWPTEANVPGASPALDGLLQRTLCEAHDRLQTAAEALCALDALSAPSGQGDGERTGPGRIVWHRLHPKYREWLLAQVSRSEVFLEDEEIVVPDVGVLARDGCVEGQSFRGGVPLAEVSVQGLLVSGHLDVLRQWLRRVSAMKGASERPFLKAVHQFLVEGAPDAARATIRQAPIRFGPGEYVDRCLLLATSLQNRVEAKQYLKQAEDHSRSAVNWRWCAAAWKEVFGDDSCARRCLLRAEVVAEDSSDWETCARGWKQNFDDGARARRCLEQAEAMARASWHWYHCAAAWKEVFGQNTNARRCLQQAQAMAKDSEDWYCCAAGWKELLSHDSNARRCLQKAEDMAKDSGDWWRCVEGWKHLLGDDTSTRRCLQQAEPHAKDTWDWLKCAARWMRLVGGDVSARRCSQQAEAVAKSAEEWCRCAERWKELFGDDADARRCLREAEAVAKRSRCWRQCAEGWKELFGDNASARRCVQLAEAVAKDSSDWQACALGWRKGFGDDACAPRCLHQAEAVAKSAEEWCWCAERWKELLGDDASASRCLHQAEAVAKQAKDGQQPKDARQRAKELLEGVFSSGGHSKVWRACAVGWKELLRDDASARRCLHQAEANAKYPGDWRECAELWMETTGDEGSARRCLQAAEAAANDSSDWQQSAKAWKELLGDVESAHRCLHQAGAEESMQWLPVAAFSKGVGGLDAEARQCLHLAESKAKSSPEWRHCARSWMSVLGDAGSARRCMQQAEVNAEDADDWRGCAQVWEESLADSEGAKRCRRRAMLAEIRKKQAP